MTVTAAVCAAFILATGAATKIGMWYYDQIPFDMRITEDYREARLVAFSGRPLHRWLADTKGGIAFAELLNRSPSQGGGLWALVGFTDVAGSPYRGGLSAFDAAGDRDTPVWQSRIEREDIPQKLLDMSRGPSMAWLYSGLRADIFDDEDTPGDEIVVVFNLGKFSQCALRILDQKGETLFQVWQDGLIRSMRWLSDPHLLVCAGGDEWLKLNDPRFQSRTTPTAPVVFAIKPVRGVVLKNFMNRMPGEGACSPEWAKYLEPPEDRNLSCGLQVNVPQELDAARFVELAVGFTPDEKSRLSVVSWVMDEHGNEVPRTRFPNDNYIIDQNSEQPRLPKADTIRLIDLQPIVKRVEPSSQPHPPAESDPDEK